MEKEDIQIESSSTSTYPMIVTQAKVHSCTVFISKTERFHLLRLKAIRADGSHCDLVGDESDFRAARKALNLFAAEANWDFDK